MGNQNGFERQNLSIKALDMLMWKFMRVCNFDENEKSFYFQVYCLVTKASEELPLNDNEQVYFIHYVLALLALQIGYQEQQTLCLEELQIRVSSYKNTNLVTFKPSDSDLYFAMAVLLYWADGDLSEKLIISVYETFETIFKQCVQGREDVPSSAKVDFIPSVILTGDWTRPISLLVHLLHAEMPTPFINVPRKISKQFQLNGVGLVMLQKLKEFNSIARVIFGVNFEYGQQTITVGGEILPRDKYLVVPKELFKNPAAQKLLIYIINQTDYEFDNFIFDETMINGEITTEYLESILKFCVEDYQLKIFVNDKGNPLRIERVINYVTGYYISYLEKVQPEKAELYSNYIYQKKDANNSDDQRVAEKLPSICSFWSRELEDMGIKVTPKKLYQSHDELKKIEKKVKVSWDDFANKFSDPNYTWAQLQIESDYLKVEPVDKCVPLNK